MSKKNKQNNRAKDLIKRKTGVPFQAGSLDDSLQEKKNETHTKKRKVLILVYSALTVVSVVFNIITIPRYISNWRKEREEKQKMEKLASEKIYLNNIVDTLVQNDFTRSQLYNYVKQLEGKPDFENEYNYFYGYYLYSFYYDDQTLIGDPEEYWKKIDVKSSYRQHSFLMRFIKYIILWEKKRISDEYASYKYLDIAEEYEKEKSKDSLYYFFLLFHLKSDKNASIFAINETYKNFMKEVNLSDNGDKSAARLKFNHENVIKDSGMQYYRYNTLKFYYIKTILSKKPQNKNEVNIQKQLSNYFSNDFFYTNVLKKGEMINILTKISFGIILNPIEYEKELDKYCKNGDIQLTFLAEIPEEKIKEFE